MVKGGERERVTERDRGNEEGEIYSYRQIGIGIEVGCSNYDL